MKNINNYTWYSLKESLCHMVTSRNYHHHQHVQLSPNAGETKMYMYVVPAYMYMCQHVCMLCWRMYVVPAYMCQHACMLAHVCCASIHVQLYIHMLYVCTYYNMHVHACCMLSFAKSNQ